MERTPTHSVCRIVLLAPVIFVAHVAEETPGFVEWANSLMQEGITERLFPMLLHGYLIIFRGSRLF